MMKMVMMMMMLKMKMMTKMMTCSSPESEVSLMLLSIARAWLQFNLTYHPHFHHQYNHLEGRQNDSNQHKDWPKVKPPGAFCHPYRWAPCHKAGETITDLSYHCFQRYPHHHHCHHCHYNNHHHTILNAIAILIVIIAIIPITTFVLIATSCSTTMEFMKWLRARSSPRRPRYSDIAWSSRSWWWQWIRWLIQRLRWWWWWQKPDQWVRVQWLVEREKLEAELLAAPVAGTEIIIINIFFFIGVFVILYHFYRYHNLLSCSCSRLLVHRDYQGNCLSHLSSLFSTPTGAR